MHVSVTKDAGSAQVKLSGRFDFNAHRDFRTGYEPLFADTEVHQVTVDLGEVDYLDSSALGMLLMLRDKASAANKALALTNVRGAVKQVLDIANFGKLFRIS
jgi:HptB-dependent secretion and biofilm anti anti-sigma factor